jgi:hypothetical protein
VTACARVSATAASALARGRTRATPQRRRAGARTQTYARPRAGGALRAARVRRLARVVVHVHEHVRAAVRLGSRGNRPPRPGGSAKSRHTIVGAGISPFNSSKPLCAHCAAVTWPLHGRYKAVTVPLQCRCDLGDAGEVLEERRQRRVDQPQPSLRARACVRVRACVCVCVRVRVCGLVCVRRVCSPRRAGACALDPACARHDMCAPLAHRTADCKWQNRLLLISDPYPGSRTRLLLSNSHYSHSLHPLHFN